MSRDLTISPAAYAALGYPHAGVVELADTPALGAGAGDGLGVRVPPPALDAHAWRGSPSSPASSSPIRAGCQFMRKWPESCTSTSVTVGQASSAARSAAVSPTSLR